MLALVESDTGRMAVCAGIAGVPGTRCGLVHLQHVDAQGMRLVNNIAEELGCLRRCHTELVRMTFPVARTIGLVQFIRAGLTRFCIDDVGCEVLLRGRDVFTVTPLVAKCEEQPGQEEERSEAFFFQLSHDPWGILRIEDREVVAGGPAAMVLPAGQHGHDRTVDLVAERTQMVQ